MDITTCSPAQRRPTVSLRCPDLLHPPNSHRRWTDEGGPVTVRSAHHRETQRRAELVAGRRERLMDAVVMGVADDPDLPALAAALGIVGVVAEVESVEASLTDRVAVCVRRSDGTVLVAQRGTQLLGLCQRQAPNALVQAVRQDHPHATVAIGLPRAGLYGAHLSLIDARRALPVARRAGEPTYFAEVWLTATLLEHYDSLDAILGPGIIAANQHPDLAETVRVYVRSGHSLSVAARTLTIHLNTVAYRLGRWEDFTGWSVRTHDGASRSIAAINLAELHGV